MRDHDVMIGSRYVPGGGVEGGFNLKRKFMSSGINWYARLLLGLPSKDNSGAFRCYRVSKLAQIDLEPGSLARLLVPGRDPLLVQAGGLPDRRDADPVREPAIGLLEDQHGARR